GKGGGEGEGKGGVRGGNSERRRSGGNLKKLRSAGGPASAAGPGPARAVGAPRPLPRPTRALGGGSGDRLAALQGGDPSRQGVGVGGEVCPGPPRPRPFVAGAAPLRAGAAAAHPSVGVARFSRAHRRALRARSSARHRARLAVRPRGGRRGVAGRAALPRNARPALLGISAGGDRGLWGFAVA